MKRSDRNTKRLLRSLESKSDIFPIERGGEGPGLLPVVAAVAGPPPPLLSAENRAREEKIPR